MTSALVTIHGPREGSRQCPGEAITVEWPHDSYSDRWACVLRYPSSEVSSELARRTVAIDIGDKGFDLPGRLPRTGPLSILVLTHSDRDHVGDAPRFFRDALVDELWLPHDWGMAYELARRVVERNYDATVLKDAIDAVSPGELLESVDAIRAAVSGDDLVGGDRRAIDYPFEPELPLDLPDSPYGQAQEPSRRFKTLEEVDEGALAYARTNARSLLGMGAGPSASSPGKRRRRAPGGTNRQVATGVVAPSRISVLAETLGAIEGARRRRRIGRVRWFSVDHAHRFPCTGSAGYWPWQVEGCPGLLSVVNAREVRPYAGVPRILSRHPLPRQQIADLMAVSYLTSQNARALVTMAFGRDDRLGPGDLVLLTSDSGLELDRITRGQSVPWRLVGAAVGLHHGSDTSDHNYIYAQLLAAGGEGGKVVLGRTGSDQVRRLNREWLAWDPARRGCASASPTKCDSARARGDVLLELDPPGWKIIENACLSGCVNPASGASAD